MKNADIINLKLNGIENTTANMVDSAAAYQLFKFKKEIQKAYTEIAKQDQELVQHCCGTYNLSEAITAWEKDHDLEMKKKIDELAAMRKELYEDTSDVKPCLICYEDWHKLQIENKEIKTLKGDTIDFFNHFYFENLLENILWKQPNTEQNE